MSFSTKLREARRELLVFALLTLGLVGGLAVLVGGGLGQHSSSGRASPSSTCMGAPIAVGQVPARKVEPNLSRSESRNKDAAHAQSATLRVIGPDGAPISGLNLSWESPVVPGTGSGVAVTDEDGCFALSVKQPGRLSVVSLDPGWRLPRDHQLVAGGEVLIPAQPAISFRLLILLEDGTPFKGGVTIWSDDSQATEGRSDLRFRQLLHHDGKDPVEVKCAPQGASLSVYIGHAILGYPAQVIVIDSASIRPGHIITISLRKGPEDSHGVLEIDLNGYRARWNRIAVTPVGQMFESAAGSPGNHEGGIWRSKPLAAGMYVARILGEPLWESEPFVVVAGQVTRLAPDLYIAATVSATIVDNQGQPLGRTAQSRGAVISRYVDCYLSDMKIASDLPGMLALSDREGKVALTGIRPGLHRFVVEAPRCEPFYVELDLMPGEIRDMGVIVLKPALGKVIVKLAGMRSEYAYTLHIDRFQGESVRTVRLTRDNEVTFEQLAFREYELTVVAGTGGRPACARVTLSAAYPVATIELDVTALEPSKR